MGQGVGAVKWLFDHGWTDDRMLPEYIERIGKMLSMGSLASPINFQALVKFLSPSPAQADAYQASVLRLAELGWSAPIQFTHLQTVEFGNPSHTADNVNEAMVEFYIQDGSERLSKTVDDILKRSELEPWHQTIAECLDSFKSARFLVVVPTMITVMEGILALKTGTFLSKEVRMIAPTKRVANAPKASRLEQSIWLSVAKLIEQLYTKASFEDEAPDFLNRHWILHGRNTSKDARLDSLRLFNLVGSLSII